MNLVKVDSTTIDSLGRRLVKFLRFGKKDVQEKLQAAPWGVDSHPIKDTIAVYAPTAERGKEVVIGYLNKNAIAALGEHRLFSTDANGDLQAYIHLKNDGTAELLGNGDNAVRYAAMNSVMQQMVTDINLQLAAIATGIAGAGGAYTPANITLDLSSAKIDEIKVP